MNARQRFSRGSQTPPMSNGRGNMQLPGELALVPFIRSVWDEVVSRVNQGSRAEWSAHHWRLWRLWRSTRQWRVVAGRANTVTRALALEPSGPDHICQQSRDRHCVDHRTTGLLDVAMLYVQGEYRRSIIVSDPVHSSVRSWWRSYL